jgi:hypothetical protein
MLIKTQVIFFAFNDMPSIFRYFLEELIIKELNLLLNIFRRATEAFTRLKIVQLIQFLYSRRIVQRLKNNI